MQANIDSVYGPWAARLLSLSVLAQKPLILTPLLLSKGYLLPKLWTLLPNKRFSGLSQELEDLRGVFFIHMPTFLITIVTTISYHCTSPLFLHMSFS